MKKSQLLLLLIFQIGAVFAANQTPDQVFFSEADKYFDSYLLPTNPTYATLQGVHLYDAKLEDYSKNGIQKEIATLNDFAKRFDAINPKALSEQAQGDYDLVTNQIRGKLLTLQTIRPWQQNPDYYSSGITASAFAIMERKYAASNLRLESLIEREKLMPAVLQNAKKNLRNVPKIFAEIALEQLPELIQFFQKDVPMAFSDVTDSTLKKQFNDSNAAVIAALQAYQNWLKQDLLPRSNGDFRLGAETYAKVLQYNEMVTTPLDKLIALDLENMQQNQKDFQRIASEVFPNKNLQDILVAIGANHPAPNKLLATFSATFDNLIRFLKEKKIITIPSDVRPIMEETPPFLRAITFASMDTPGPFEPAAKEAYFNVTLPAADWTKERTDGFMRAFSYPLISSIAAHETYPGHYVQFIWMQNIHDRVRKLLGAMSNAEGWAHYSEQMILDEGFATKAYGAKTERDAKLLRLGQLLEALLRNARFIVGIEMHTGKMTYDQAIDFFVKEGYQSREAGTVEAKRGTSDPTYLYYTLGKLQILKLRKDLEAKEGDKFNLQHFHDDFMKQGFPPIKIVRKALLHDDSPTL